MPPRRVVVPDVREIQTMKTIRQKLALHFLLVLIAMAVLFWCVNPTVLADFSLNEGSAPERQDIVVLSSAQLHSLSGTEQVSLPYRLEPSHFLPKGSRVRFVMAFDLPQLGSEPLGIFISKASLGAQLHLNGTWLAACDEAALEELRCLHRPWLETPPHALWKPGRNVLEVEIYADDRQMNGLSVVRVGPSHLLDVKFYTPRYLVSVQLLRALTWITGSLGVLCLVVALHLPGRSIFLWAGLACVVNAISNVNFLAVEAWPSLEVFSWFAYSARLASVPLVMLACIAFYGRDRSWHQVFALSYALFAPMVVWFSGDSRTVVALLYVPVMALGFLLAVQLARWTWTSRKVSHVLMLLAYLALIGAGLFDWLRLRGDSAFEGQYLLAYVSAGFLAMIASLVMAELAAALSKARDLTLTLEKRVAEREQQIEQMYVQRLGEERAAAITQERERLLSDMHDSVGSGLSTTHLLLRQGQVSPQEAAFMVQECIDDLRLVFDVSSNLDEDLGALMADVRHRLEGRLASVGLKSRWSVSVEGMPLLDSTRSLQVMRILHEALTNAMRHAKATELQVSLQWMADEGVLQLRVHDDGQGLREPTSHRGRGLANMRRRAQLLGATLTIESARPGTLVQLRLAV